jgi:hypothetical protein
LSDVFQGYAAGNLLYRFSVIHGAHPVVTSRSGTLSQVVECRPLPESYERARLRPVYACPKHHGRVYINSFAPAFSVIDRNSAISGRLSSICNYHGQGTYSVARNWSVNATNNSKCSESSIATAPNTDVPRRNRCESNGFTPSWPWP